jgi:hypothetical protein
LGETGSLLFLLQRLLPRPLLLEALEMAIYWGACLALEVAAGVQGWLVVQP